MVDDDYNFIYVDVGAEGKAADGGIWRQTSLSQHLESPRNKLNVPLPCHLPTFPGELPYFLAADSAFALSSSVQKPYPNIGLTRSRRVYNYRLCRARRIVENAFGILATRFRIFRRTLEISPQNVDKVVLASVTLHNFLRQKCGKQYIGPVLIDHENPEHNYIPGRWRDDFNMPPLAAAAARNADAYSKQGREILREYFLTDAGELPWQYDRI